MKTAFVAVVMLVVLYGVYVMINKKPIGPPPGAGQQAGWNPPQVDFGPGGSPTQLGPPELSGAAPLPAMTPPQAGPPPTALTESSSAAGNASPYWNNSAAGSQANKSAPPIVAPGATADTQEPSPWETSGTASRYTGAPPEGLAENSPEVPSAYTGAGQASSQGYPHEDAGATAADRANSALAGTGFSMMWRGVQDQLAKGELAAALETLSLWYDSQDIPADVRPMMVDLLDQLAGEVIYSREHYLEEAYDVRPGEQLVDVARQFQVPWQLLANINGIEDPAHLEPGTRLKVIRGPFNAVVNLQTSELTLMVDGRYAGRFPVRFGNDPAPMSGEFHVREKDVEKTFYDRDGRAIAPGDELNPYGPYWIGLGGSLAIHGAPQPLSGGRRPSTGSIVVDPDHARDLYAILSEDSQVIIRR